MLLNRAVALAVTVLLASCGGESTQTIVGATEPDSEKMAIDHIGGMHSSLTRIQSGSAAADFTNQRHEMDRALETFRSVLGTPLQALSSPLVNGGTGALRGIAAKSFQELVNANKRLPVSVVDVRSADSSGRAVTAREYRVDNRLVFRVTTSSRLLSALPERSRPSSGSGRFGAAQDSRFLWTSNAQYDTLPFYFLEIPPEDPYWETESSSEERAAFAAGFAAVQADLDAMIADIQIEDPAFILASSGSPKGVADEPCVSLIRLASYSFDGDMDCNPYATRLAAVGGAIVAVGSVGAAIAATVSPEPISKLALGSLWTLATGAVIGAAALIVMHRDCVNEQSQASLNPLTARLVRGNSSRDVQPIARYSRAYQL